MNEELECRCCLQTGHSKWGGGFPEEVLCEDAVACLDRAVECRT